jgi:hypothetical protein
VLGWYLRGRQRCGAEPALYLIALSAPNPALPQGYYRTATVQVDGRAQIGVYQRTPPTGPPDEIDLEAFVAAFDQQMILAPGDWQAASC